MKLAIASPSDSAYSETFIRMQIERLPCALRIHGGPVASKTIPGGPIEPLRNIRGLLDTAIECGLRGRRWEGPQAKELGRRLRRSNIDVLLANYGSTGVALSPLCKDLGIRLIVHFHGYDAHMDSVLDLHADDYRRLGSEAFAVIAVSNHMVAALENVGISKQKIHLMRYGVDSECFAAKVHFPSHPLFFGVGRFVEKKAPYLTILAFNEVRKHNANARLVMAGDGPLFETSRNLCKSLGLDGFVSFPGIISSKEVAEWMKNATAYVQHSITPLYGPSKGDSEGTPVAVLEALITGLPVISTYHAGIGDVVVSGETGLLVNERDVQGMAKAMISLCDDTYLAKRLGENARQSALSHYTADHYINSLISVISKI
jgi:glycosyltransferase involved in cell wall biosynthesis